MSDFEELAARYIATWNEADAGHRQKLIAELWAEDGTYTDPLADVARHAGIGAVIAGAREQFPGFRFHLVGGVDANHHIARFRWELVADSGAEALVVGFDVAVATTDGRPQAVYGFLDKVPAA